MPSDDGDYEPALDSTTTEEASVEAEPVVKRSEAAEKIGLPAGEDEDARLDAGPRLPRRWSDKSRAMFRGVVKAVQAGEVDTGGDLEPMAHEPVPAVPAVVPATPAAAPAVPAPAAPAAPVTPPAGLPALPELPLAAKPQPTAAQPVPDPRHAEREAALAAREAALVEREKLLPDRLALAERPGAALVEWLRDVHGITDPADLKTALADLITEASEIGLDVKLPPEVKAPAEARKAMRSVKAYQAQLTAREKALAEKTAATEKAAAEAREKAESEQREAAYVSRIGELIAPAKEQHKFLHDPEVTGGLSAQAIVYEVLKEQKRLGQTPDLATATDYANNYYKAQAENAAKKAAYFQSLLAPATPAPAVVPATAAPSPGGAPGPAPKTPAAPAPVEWDPSDLPMDRQQRRQASLAKLVAARKAQARQ